VRRYEHAAQGDLVHVDIKKLGRIPDGGGWKTRGRTIGNRHNKRSRPGYAYLHNAIDDHSRLAYTEILTDETKESAAAFWGRANAYFNACGITVSRVLTDNGSATAPKSSPPRSARKSPTNAPGPNRPSGHPAARPWTDNAHGGPISRTRILVFSRRTDR
jgi:Integrase core domain